MGRPRSGVVLRTILVSAAAFASIAFTKLALFAGVAIFLAFVSLPKGEDTRGLKWLLAFAALAAGVGFTRFLVIEAVPGIVEGGTGATEQAAVSHLREILFAEDALRKNAAVDPDGDHIGSAAFLGELTGEVGVRGGPRFAPSILEGYPKTTATALGPAAEVAGYFVIVCLPKPGGGFTARPGDAVDDELAERQFVAYAWPAASGQGLSSAYFLDEHERILVADSSEQIPRRLLGVDAPPACDDALAPETASAWRVWRHKKPRSTLPFLRR
jgi:hypothetical protein